MTLVTNLVHPFYQIKKTGEEPPVAYLTPIDRYKPANDHNERKAKSREKVFSRQMMNERLHQAEVKYLPVDVRLHWNSVLYFSYSERFIQQNCNLRNFLGYMVYAGI